MSPKHVKIVSINSLKKNDCVHFLRIANGLLYGLQTQMEISVSFKIACIRVNLLLIFLFFVIVS